MKHKVSELRSTSLCLNYDYFEEEVFRLERIKLEL